MKIILIAMIIGCCLIADDLGKLEQSYLSKAETLQADSDKDIKARKDKLAKESKRLAAAYLRALKKIEVSIVQKGDLDAALIVRAKIKEIEAVLKGQIVVVIKPVSTIVTKPIGVHHDLVGVWKTTNTRGARYIYTFYSNKTTLHENNLNSGSITGKWTILDDTIFIKFANGHSIELKRKGNIYKSKIFTFKKEVIDSVVGKWQVQYKTGKILTLKADHTVTISNVPNKIFKWNIQGDKIHFIWSNGHEDTYTVKNNEFINGKSKSGHRIQNYKKIDSAKHFYNKETIINTHWIVHDEKGKKTGVEITLLTGGKFKVINAPWFRSYWKWGFKDGCIIYGASTVNGCKVDFSKDGQQAIKFYNIGRKESYPGIWILKK